MGEKRKSMAEPLADSSQSASSFAAPSSAVDATLACLFAASSGPVTAPPLRYGSHWQTPAPRKPDSACLTDGTKAEQENAGSKLNLPPPEPLSDNRSTSSAESKTHEDTTPLPSRKRKRGHMTPADDIEGAYTKRLADREIRIQGHIQATGRPASPSVPDTRNAGGLQEQIASDGLEARGSDRIPQHESLNETVATNTTGKSDRTVFLGNVSVEAIKSKSARKVLLNHLSSCLPEVLSTAVPQKVESLRFRSTAFASGFGPKRAAYATKELMEETTHSTNAYVIYSTPAAAEKAAATLNGTVVLGRHLRTDSVARPAEPDYRRCVFIGNLGFVDEEMVDIEADRGIKERKRRAKQPADAEEGLWRTFNKAGEVESVRVVRDKFTRVGKGIAYVQFRHENSVEAALLCNDKKFPPLLPRKLRVTRARKPKKSQKPPPLVKDRAKHSNMTVVARNRRGIKGVLPIRGERHEQPSKAESFVFEGHRATRPADYSGKGGLNRRKYAAKPNNRSSRRGSEFKAAGGKRQRR